MSNSNPGPPIFRLSTPANQDIDAIWDYTLERSYSIAVADKVVSEIYAAFDLLAAYPEAGHSRTDLIDKPLKFWSVYRYLIAYNPQGSPIEIVAVIHGARDVPAVLEEH